MLCGGLKGNDYENPQAQEIRVDNANHPQHIVGANGSKPT
jgi:hypothetical protein